MKLKGRIGLIGCGNMGSAIISGLLKKRLARASQILVCDAVPSKMNSIARVYGVHPVRKSQDLIRRSRVFILAVKPQDLRSVANEIRGVLNSKHIVVSILAGTPISKLRRFLGTRAAIVRAMPNLGAQVGEAVTALSASSPRARTVAEVIFSGCGEVCFLPERHFDLVTAVSGSGPAYFFLMMELLVQVARKGGMSERTARLLAVQTAVGAACLAQKSSRSPAELRKMVTSKKGTTEAALRFLSKKKFSSIFTAAVHEAARRARQLSRS